MSFPTTFGDLQTSVIAKLRLDATNDLQKVKDWINQVYAQVCVETEAVQDAGQNLLVADAASYELPTEILRMKQVVITPYGETANGPGLTEVSLEDILSRRQGWESGSRSGGAPSHYALVGLTRLELWPTPSAADTITFYYVALPTALSASDDTPVLQEPYGSKILEYGALAEGADFLKDPDVDRYRGLYDLWMNKFRTHLNRRGGGHTKQLAVVGYQWPLPHDNSVDTGW